MNACHCAEELWEKLLLDIGRELFKTISVIGWQVLMEGSCTAMGIHQNGQQIDRSYEIIRAHQD